MSHPHLLVLSQLADHELSAPEAAVIDAHVSACAPCRDRLARVAHALHGVARGARTEARAEVARTDACPSPSALSAWRDPLLPAAERAALGRHLESCDACLGEALAASGLLARMDATPPLPVPAALRARVASAAPQPVQAESALSRLVVRVTRGGVELLESHLLAPLRDLVLAPLPLPALRGRAPVSSAVSFTLHAPAATITATIDPGDESVAVTLRIADLGGVALAGERVFLRRHGRSIFSARTGDDGTLRLPGVEHGVYEVACPGIGTAFRLDLRS